MVHNPGQHNTLIASATLAGSSYTIYGISQNFDDLLIIMKNIRNGHATSENDVALYFNSDTNTANYDHTRFYQQSTSEVSSSAAGNLTTNSCALNKVGGAYATIWLPDYTGVANNQQCKSMSAVPANTSMADFANFYQYHSYGVWTTMAAVNSLTFTNTGGQAFGNTSKVYVFGVSYNRP